MRADALAEIGAGWRIACASGTATIAAIRYSTRGAVVASGNDAVILDDDSADLSADAVAAAGDNVGNIHEICVPAWSIKCLVHESTVGDLEWELQVATADERR